MSLSRKIADAVERLARAGEDAKPDAVTAEDLGRRLTLHAVAAGPVGLAFDALVFEAEGARSAEALHDWADRLATRLRYLMEPLAVVEHDRPSGVLLMRSQSPTHRHGLRAFYEMTLDSRGTLRLGRVAFDETTRARRPEPCRLTVEALERLADDLVAAVG